MLWAYHSYWPSDFRQQVTTVAGDDAVRRLLDWGYPSGSRAALEEKLFGPVEEG